MERVHLAYDRTNIVACLLARYRYSPGGGSFARARMHLSSWPSQVTCPRCLDTLKVPLSELDWPQGPGPGGTG